jgi:branched-chain amino acid transport system ATP-binding protein
MTANHEGATVSASESAKTPLFEVNDLAAGYGTARVLHGVSLKVGRGESVAVLGPNGAGKSTLLRAIFQACRVFSGGISMEGADVRDVADFEVAKLGIAHVPEGRGLFPEMTVTENLVLGGLSFVDRLGNRDRIEAVMEMFPQLRDRTKQIVGTMSGGEQQMVAIGRALMSEPKLLLLDEPSLGLAPKVVESIFAQLRNLSDSARNLSILIVEQRVHEALDLCARGYVIQGGEVVLSGTTDELRTNAAMESAFFGDAVTDTPDRPILRARSEPSPSPSVARDNESKWQNQAAVS